jgi:hypothetical protein
MRRVTSVTVGLVMLAVPHLFTCRVLAEEEVAFNSPPVTDTENTGGGGGDASPPDPCRWRNVAAGEKTADVYNAVSSIVTLEKFEGSTTCDV